MPSRRPVPPPTRQQYRLARLISGWYLNRYHGTPNDIGVASMFCDSERIGEFAVGRDALAAGDGSALFRVLIAATMFQRRQDAQILRILQGISRSDADEITDAPGLVKSADESPCIHLRSNATLIRDCDLGKDPVTKVGVCSRRPKLACHLKRHTVLLKRYGHFGKVPTSAALNHRDYGVCNPSALRIAVLRDSEDSMERAAELKRRLSGAWRVSEKIAALFLSAVSNPDLSPGLAPWSEGIDWTRYVVIDSNVDLFLKHTNYPGPWTYAARSAFIRRLAKRVDLADWDLQRFNPRIVQQAIYLFMSESNRRGSLVDCAQGAPASCRTCPPLLRGLCPLGG